MKPIYLFTLIIALQTTLLAQSKVILGEEEIRKSPYAKFENRSDKYATPEQKALEVEIGKGLHSLVIESKKPIQYKGFTVQRFYSEEKGKYGGDILILNKNASYGHINSIKRILNAYIQSSFEYTEKNADVLVMEVLYYNAQNRGRLDRIKKKYTKSLLASLNKKKVGISKKFSDWPGNTQIVIPIKSSLDTAKEVPEIVNKDDNSNSSEIEKEKIKPTKAKIPSSDMAKENITKTSKTKEDSKSSETDAPIIKEEKKDTEIKKEEKTPPINESEVNQPSKIENSSNPSSNKKPASSDEIVNKKEKSEEKKSAKKTKDLKKEKKLTDKKSSTKKNEVGDNKDKPTDSTPAKDIKEEVKKNSEITSPTKEVKTITETKKTEEPKKEPTKTITVDDSKKEPSKTVVINEPKKEPAKAVTENKPVAKEVKTVTEIKKEEDPKRESTKIITADESKKDSSKTVVINEPKKEPAKTVTENKPVAKEVKTVPEIKKEEDPKRESTETITVDESKKDSSKTVVINEPKKEPVKAVTENKPVAKEVKTVTEIKKEEDPKRESTKIITADESKKDSSKTVVINEPKKGPAKTVTENKPVAKEVKTVSETKKAEEPKKEQAKTITVANKPVAKEVKTVPEIKKVEEPKKEIVKKEITISQPAPAKKVEEKLPTTKTEIKKMQKELTELKVKEKDKVENSENVVGEKIVFLKVKEFLAEGHYSSEMWAVDTENDDELFQSPFKKVCGKEFKELGTGVVVMSFKETDIIGSDTHHLALLDKDNLKLIKQTPEVIFWRSFLKEQSSKIYAIEFKDGKYFLAQFKDDLTFEMRSNEPINPDCEIAFKKNKIYLTKRSADNTGVSIRVLNRDNLKLRDVKLVK